MRPLAVIRHQCTGLSGNRVARDPRPVLAFCHSNLRARNRQLAYSSIDVGQQNPGVSHRQCPCAAPGSCAYSAVVTQDCAWRGHEMFPNRLFMTIPCTAVHGMPPLMTTLRTAVQIMTPPGGCSMHSCASEAFNQPLPLLGLSTPLLELLKNPADTPCPRI